MAERVFRFDLASGGISERRRTPQGGLVAKANFTRTGVFTYRMPDGSSRRELRHPDEVMHPESLATYPGAPITIDHPGRVTPENWRDVTVGHVAHGVRADGQFVTGEAHLQDARAIDQAERGDLRELSCGYTCDIDPTPGEYQGEKYDVAQRNIRINHVAAGPAGWGRMGPDARLKLDSAEAVSGEHGGPYVRDDHDEAIHGGSSMTPEEKAALEKAEKAARDALAVVETLRGDNAELTENLRSLTAERDALKLQADRQRTDAANVDQRARQDSEFRTAVREMIVLQSDARIVFATPEDPQGLKWDAGDKSPDDIRREIIKHLEPKQPLVYDGKELDGRGLKAVYDAHMTRKRETDKARADAQEAAAGQRREDAGGGGDGCDDDEPVDAEKSRKDMYARKRDAFKKKTDKSKG
jgi:hypothetical protein